MYLYNFDIVTKKIIEYNNDNSNVMIVELYQPLLDFVNCNFTDYDLLRQKILQFIQEFENSFNDLDSDEIVMEIKKNFYDFHNFGIDNGEIWWIAELINHLYCKSPYETFFFTSGFFKRAIQDGNDFDYLYWQNEIRDKVKKIFDIDNNDFIDNFSPMCRLNYYYGETFFFNEMAIIHPSEHEKFSDGYDFFAYPFDEASERFYNEEEYGKYELQRQKFIQNHLHIINGYKFTSLEEAFNCEIFKMAQLGITLKRCENCGKYFIFNQNRPARYCINKLPNINMTCQQVAAQRKYKEKQSPIQKAYTNALKNRNKWYPSQKSGLRTQEQSREYENWKKKISEIRNEYQQKYNNAQTDIQQKKILEEFKKNLNS